MKTIIVYYSLEGNSQYAAEKMAEQLGSDILRLEPIKEYPKGNVSKYIWGGKSVVFGETPKLIPYKFDTSGYDRIVIGTPIWAGEFTPPIKTFLKENQISQKKVAFFATHGGGGADKCFAKLQKELSSCEVVATLELIEPKDKQEDKKDSQIEAFCQKLKMAEN